MMQQPFTPIHDDATPSGVMRFNHNARPLFYRARMRAEIRQTLSAVVGRSRTLPRYRGTFAVGALPGIHAIPIAQIKGSVSRTDVFDCELYPTTDEVEDRWVRIASILLQGNALPPVDLIRGTDNLYYVIDGHHRISVYRMLGHTHVDALVHIAEP